MNRLAAILLSLAALGLCSCGSEGSGGGSATGDATGGSDLGADPRPGDPGPAGDSEGTDPGTASDPGPADPGPPPTPPTCRFGPYAASVFDAPWPSDALRGADGKLDLSLFPGRAGAALVDKYVGYAERHLDGYSTNTGIYVVFDAPIDATALPAPEDTTGAESPVLLVNVSRSSKRYGERVPLLLDAWNRSDGVYYEPNTLIVHPLWGFVLEEGATYALVVTTDLPGRGGTRVKASADFLAALDGKASANPTQAAALAPLASWLDDAPADLRSRLACGTVFSTSKPTAEFVEMAAFVHDMSPETQIDIPMVFEGVKQTKTTSFFDRYEGTYRTPNFQKGTKPYLTGGGGFDFEEDGTPIIQFAEEIKVVLGIPKVGTKCPGPNAFENPEDWPGWPVVVHAHGTGGSFDSHFTASGGANASPAGRLAAECIASVGIAQPLHGERCTVAGCDSIEFLSFNILNPDSARSLFRQGALDSVFLVSLLSRGVSLPGTGEQTLRLDPKRIYFFGHSQGGITGALVAAAEDRVGGFLLSGAGGGLAITVLERKDITDFAGLVRQRIKLPKCRAKSSGSQGCELTVEHPVLTIIQTLVDATDPINYAPAWLSGVHTGHPQNLMMTQGLEDEATPPATSDALAISARLPIARPVERAILGLDLLGIDSIPLPASENIEDPIGQRSTAALLQYAGYGHFAVFSAKSGAIPTYRFFFRSLAEGNPALLRR